MEQAILHSSPVAKGVQARQVVVSDGKSVLVEIEIKLSCKTIPMIKALEQHMAAGCQLFEVEPPICPDYWPWPCWVMLFKIGGEQLVARLAGYKLDDSA